MAVYTDLAPTYAALQSQLEVENTSYPPPQLIEVYKRWVLPLLCDVSQLPLLKLGNVFYSSFDIKINAYSYVFNKELASKPMV